MTYSQKAYTEGSGVEILIIWTYLLNAVHKKFKFSGKNKNADKKFGHSSQNLRISY